MVNKLQQQWNKGFNHIKNSNRDQVLVSTCARNANYYFHSTYPSIKQ